MTAYSPFEKPLKELEAEDLVSLKSASEGWYIEYKREVPPALSIAKSISAFANTYGGWLFYGVEEKSKEDSVAGAFPGISREQVDAALQRIRQAVATLLNPAAHFDVKVLWGACQAIGLETDRAVICVHVPWSPNTPHVHKSGHIYRRVADGSEPKPESDRFLLDQLWKRGNDLRKGYKRWVTKKLSLSKAEDGKPFLRLLLTADLWHEKDIWCDISVNEFREIVGAKEGSVSTTPFDTAHMAANGLIARQLFGNDPHNLGLTWKFYRDLSSEIIIPLPMLETSVDNISFQLHGYDNAELYVGILRKYNYIDARVIDLNLLFHILLGIVNIHDKLCARTGWDGPVFAKVRMTGVWRTTPFIDIPHILEGIRSFGLPMCLDDDVTAWPGTDPSTFFEIPPYEHVEVADAQVMLKAFHIFIPIAHAFGIPGWRSTPEDSDELDFSSELLAAGTRGMEAQRIRNERARIQQGR